MSLTKKPELTRKRIVASQANGRLSHGPATAAGKKHIREANTRHAFYSNAAEAEALTCLGEDPADLERLRQNLLNDFDSPNALQVEMAEHLAQVVWRWRRAGRGQDGFALRLAINANLTRDDRLHGQMMRLKITAETLRRLAQSVAQEHYATTPADLDMMKNLHQQGAVKEMGEIALALFYRLHEPGEKDAAGKAIDEYEQAQLVVAQVKEIFGIGTSRPRPTDDPALIYSPPDKMPHVISTMEGEKKPLPSRFSPADEESRERARQLLENILNRQADLCETQRKAILKGSMAGPTPYERAAEITLAHPQLALMQRMEESSFRQIWRMTTLLLKIQKQTPSENPERGRVNRECR